MNPTAAIDPVAARAALTAARSFVAQSRQMVIAQGARLDAAQAAGALAQLDRLLGLIDAVLLPEIPETGPAQSRPNSGHPDERSSPSASSDPLEEDNRLAGGAETAPSAADRERPDQ